MKNMCTKYYFYIFIHLLLIKHKIMKYTYECLIICKTYTDMNTFCNFFSFYIFFFCNNAIILRIV